MCYVIMYCFCNKYDHEMNNVETDDGVTLAAHSSLSYVLIQKFVWRSR